MSMKALFSSSIGRLLNRDWGDVIKIPTKFNLETGEVSESRKRGLALQELVEEIVAAMSSTKPIEIHAPIEIINKGNGPAIKITQDGNPQQFTTTNDGDANVQALYPAITLIDGSSTTENGGAVTNLYPGGTSHQYTDQQGHTYITDNTTNSVEQIDNYFANHQSDVENHVNNVTEGNITEQMTNVTNEGNVDNSSTTIINNGGGGGGGDSGGGGGTTVVDGTTISASYGAFIARFTLANSLTEGGTSAGATLLEGTSFADSGQTFTISGHGSGFRGYLPSGKKVLAYCNQESGAWYAMSPGWLFVRGTLNGTLTSGGNQTITTTSGETVRVYEVLDVGATIASGVKVAASWNSDTLHFETHAAKC